MKKKVIGIESHCSIGDLEIPYDEKADVREGDKVIFKDPDGKEEYGIVRYVNCDLKDEERFLRSSKILRKATANDMQKVESNAERNDSALKLCKELVAQYGLNMVVFMASYSFDGSKTYFTFTAEERVDFRELVKELARKLKKQIQLRQIGPRDKAKFIGGYGRCGRQLCCGTFLGKFESINMEMVRYQGLEGKGSSKLSGVCGKLLCCLKYEVEAYRDFRKNLPNIGDLVKFKKASAAPEKEGKVIAIDILNQKVRAFFMKTNESLTLNADEIDKIIKAARYYAKTEEREAPEAAEAPEVS